MAGTATTTPPDITSALEAASRQPLLTDLGAPVKSELDKHGTVDQCLVWLHLGSAWLKLSVIADLAEFYCKCTQAELAWLGYGASLEAVGGADGARGQARICFKAAIETNGALAEAHFALGRVEQLCGNTSSALDNFQICAGLAQHPLAMPDAHLKANAFWEAATILDDTRRDNEALQHYQKAISLLDNFGVHHVRYARFLRRIGKRDEAANHYLACARYTHRYFPEFQPPPLIPAPSPTQDETLDAIFTTPDGDTVYFHAGRYTLLPAGEHPHTPAQLARLFEAPAADPGAGRRARVLAAVSRLLRPRKSGSSPPLADSIAELV